MVRAADRALDYYRAHGFVGDRSRLNTHGYAEILRQLREPPPWIEVEINDSVGEISPERRKHLRPLVEQVHDASDEELIKRFQICRERSWHAVDCAIGVDLSFRRYSIELERVAFRDQLALARILGADVTQQICQAVFDEFDGIDEDIRVTAGAPDILVWLPNAEAGVWFFSEVKAPGDYLSKNQKAWLNRNWDVVGGHFLVTALE